MKFPYRETGVSPLVSNQKMQAQNFEEKKLVVHCRAFAIVSLGR